MQKKTLQITLTVLFLAFALTLMSTSTIAASSSPTVDTDKPIYPYWKVGGDVTIFGSGYNASYTYAVAIAYPGQAPQIFSLFTAVTDFEYIHPLLSPYPAGTYLVQIIRMSPTPQVVVEDCHFGVWGIDPPVYNRGENITIQGGGVCPLSTVGIDIFYDEDGNLTTTNDQTQVDVPAHWGSITDPTADGAGEFTCEVSVPCNAWVSDTGDPVYFVKITYDSYDGCGTIETSLTDTQTFEVSETYTVTISDLPTEVMNRGEDVTFTVTVIDASGDPVTGATISFNDPKGGTVTSGVTDNLNGTYSVTYTIADDDPVGTWTITATATKCGNTGSSPGTDTVEISATYTISWYDPTSAVLKNRGHTQNFAFNVTDASGDPVNGLTTLFLDIDGDLATTDDQDSISLTQVGPGNYTGSWTVPCGAPTGDYDCIVTKYGNRGETPDYVTVSDLILVDVSTSKAVYGGLETLVINAVIDYEDGANFTDSDGTAVADIWIDANGNGERDAGEFVLVTSLSLYYNSTSDVWYRSYDLYPPGAINGTYTLLVNASDGCNSGEDTLTFRVEPQTLKDPTHGPVGTEVDIWGSGFAPDTDVFVAWNMSITGDFVGKGDGVTTEFILGLGSVKPGTETIYLDGEPVPTTAYTIDYETSVVTFGTAPGYGVVITADYELLIPLAETMTNEYGSFTANFTVPESYACDHVVIATDGMDNVAMDIFCVEPQIVLSSTKGPPEAWITVTGTGFAPNSEVDIDAVLPYYFVEISWAVAKTDAYGTFAEAIMLPMTNLYYQFLDMLWYADFPTVAPIGIWACDNDENWDFTFYLAFLWCQEDTIDVDVEVGELYFPGEVITVYALTSVDGVPTDVENIEFLLYYETLGPIPLSQFLPIVHVDTGLYAVTTTLPGDMNPGNYLFEVKASKATYYIIAEPWEFAAIWWEEWGYIFEDWEAPEYWFEAWEELGCEYLYMKGYEATINGVGIEGFIISPTLIGMNAMITEINGTIATVVVPGIRQILLDLSAINATISELITTSKGEILAKIDTAVGTIEAKLDAINATLTGLITNAKGEILAEISTAVGTITTTLSSINGTLTTIEGDVATIITEVGAIELKLDDTVIPFLQAINATIVDLEKKIDGYYLALNTTIGEIVLKVDPGVFVYLEAIEAKLDFVNATTIRIESAIGDVEVKLDDIGDFLDYINATLTALDGRLATIETDIGKIQVDIASINASITSIEGNIVTITTTLGTIEGRITAIEGDIATIKTDIGEIQVDLPPLQESSSAIKSTTTLGMSIGSLLSAIAAIAAVAACILVYKRLRVAS